jgi:hypothetical protein
MPAAAIHCSIARTGQRLACRAGCRSRRRVRTTDAGAFLADLEAAALIERLS